MWSLTGSLPPFAKHPFLDRSNASASVLKRCEGMHYTRVTQIHAKSILQQIELASSQLCDNLIDISNP